MRTKATHGAYSVPSTESDKNDCGVRALMVAACIDYATAHAFCNRAGRVNGRGMWNHQMTFAIDCALGRDIREQRNAPRVVDIISNRIGNYTLYEKQIVARRRYYPTAAEFIRQHPRGHFIVRTRGHYFAICDGIVHDWFSMDRRQGARAKRGVQSFWQLV